MSLAARTSLAGHPHTRARGPNPAILRSGMVPVVATADHTPASAHRRIPGLAQAEGRVPPRSAGRHSAQALARQIGIPGGIWNSSPTPVRYLDADIPAPDVYAKLAPAQ